MVSVRPHERALIERLKTPEAAQRWLDSLAFNAEGIGRTMRPFRGVVETGTAHCIEGALAAAFILQHHGHAPILLDLWSDDRLDHVVLLFRGRRGWGALGKSQYAALEGRKPAFRTVRDLAWSYVDPYVDETGRVNGYATLDLRTLGPMGWSLSSRNAWRVERALLANVPAPLRASDARHERWLKRYRAWKVAHPGIEPPPAFYDGAESFLPTHA